ncbi:MAG: DNA mismatch repair protein MutS [Pseudomonadota bacterium]
MQLEQFKEKYKYDKATPVMRQFLDVKFANIDCLVLFRMGDFYELFYEDAITAARVLGIALTKRGKTGDDEIAMCGVPYHALENYLNKLLEDGFKVAICDQLETPEEAKKRGGYKAVVNRDVTRIITPGTIIEESLLDVGEPNYLVSIAIGKNNAALSYVDLSTSEIAVISVPEGQIINELARLKPKEILLAEKYRASELASQIGSMLNMRISFQVDSFFAVNKCRKNLLDFYQIKDVGAIGELEEIHISAVGGIIEYISITQKDSLPKLPKPKILNYQKFMTIDAQTRRNLEICLTTSGSMRGSLFDCIDHSVTKSGSRLLYKYLSTPLIDIQEINKRLELTKYFYDDMRLTNDLRALLKKTGDLERCITRLNMGRSTPKDLLSIKYTIEIAEEIRAAFVAQKGIELPQHIEKLVKPLVGLNDLYESIDSVIKDDAPNITTNGGIIKHEYHPKVKELYDLINNSHLAIEKLRDQYRKETGIDTLKISNNNVLGLFIDITARHANKIFDEKFIHRQTTANSIRYTTTELQELESKIVNAKILVISLEQEIYNELCKQIAIEQSALYKMSESLSLLDVYSNFAYVADENNYVMPEISSDMIFEIKGGRHPIVEKALKKSRESFIHNDCSLEFDERVWLLTGPNMAGKSTYLRQNAIISILAHIGSFVPAESAKIGIIDKIFSRIGAGDDLNKGQSTFMLEMLETSAILAQATHKSLIILDEVGRGTSTYDGVAIAWSVLEYVHDKIRARCLFATHYHELTKMEEVLPALKNYTVAIDDTGESVLFLHKIKRGSADKSYGVHVAQMAGLPKSVIQKAASLLEKFEKESNKSNKKMMKQESYNMNLFEIENSAKNPKHKKLFDEFVSIEPDKLSPKEALDVLYKLKDIS